MISEMWSHYQAARSISGTQTILATPGPFAAFHHPSALAVQPIIHASAAGPAGPLFQPIAMPPPRYSVNTSVSSADTLVFPQGPHGPFAAAANAAAPGAYQPIVYWYPSPPVSPQSAAVTGHTGAGTATPTTYYIHTTASTSTALDQFPATVLMKGLPQNVQSSDVMAFLDGLVEVCECSWF